MLNSHTLGQPTGRASRSPHHVEVLGLRSSHDVEDFVGVKLPDAITNGREVSGGVAKSLVGLLNNQWQRLVFTIREAREKDDLGAVALHK